MSSRFRLPHPSRSNLVQFGVIWRNCLAQRIGGDTKQLARIRALDSCSCSSSPFRRQASSRAKRQADRSADQQNALNTHLLPLREVGHVEENIALTENELLC